MALQFHVVMPIQQVFSRLFPDRRYTLEPLDKKFIAERNNKESFTARPDFMFSVNDQPLVSLEVQYPHVKFFHKKHFVPVFTQAVYQCLCCKTRYGVITDYFTTMVFRIELQDEDFKEIRENTYPVPIGEFTLGLKRLRIVYVMVRHDQSKDTLTAIVAQHIALAHEEMLDDKGREATERGMEYLAKALTLTEEEREERDQAAYGQFLSRSTSDQSGKGGLKIFDRVCDTSEYTVLQEGRANAQVLKIGRRLFEEITGKRATADSYILKIFDPVHGKRNHGDVSSDIESTKKSALREYGVYQKLKGLWGVCVPILYHSELCLLRADGRIRFGGFYLVIQYLEGGRPKLTDFKLQETAQWALGQLHSKGVAHGDVKLKNMINHEGRVFMIDFDFSITMTSKRGGKRGTSNSRSSRDDWQPMRMDNLKLQLLIQEARDSSLTQT